MACFIVPLVQAVATTVYRKRHAAAIAAPDAPGTRPSSGIVFPTWRKCSGAAP